MSLQQSNRDPETLRQALLVWLHERLPAAEAIALPILRRPDAGGSSETLFLDPVITERGTERREAWVLRIEATGHQVYEDPSVARQYRVMQSLALTGAVPVPQVLWLEADRSVLGAPFFMMQRVAGSIPDSLHHSKGYLAEVSPAERAEIWTSAIETLARIHSVDVEPFAFLARSQQGVSGLDQELAVWDSYLSWSGIAVRPIQQRARRWLEDRLPANRPTGLAWGDARPGNMIFRHHRCVAVIDWETVSLGGAETDLGWWLFYDWFMSDGIDVPRLPGVPDRDATIKLWESFAGRKAHDMEWHEVFATWRFSLISDRARLLASRAGGRTIPSVTGARSPHAERLVMLTGA
jgi:aminoglycoside phosphotransferase (APT) family kinase protein